MNNLVELKDLNIVDLKQRYLDYIDVSEKERLDKFNDRMKTGRILVNTPSSQGGIGDLYNFKLMPSLTLGCGSWGGNSLAENIGVKHLLNIKTVAERRENMLWFRAPEKVYIKKGCLPVALQELKDLNVHPIYIADLERYKIV